jgi:hypothetical protein
MNMKKIVLTLILLASSLTWAAPTTDERGGGVAAVGSGNYCPTCPDQEGLPATLTGTPTRSAVDQSPYKQGTLNGSGAPTSHGPAQGNQDKQGE